MLEAFVCYISVVADRYNFMVLVARWGRLYVLSHGQSLTISSGLAEMNFVYGYLTLKYLQILCKFLSYLESC